MRKATLSEVTVRVLPSAVTVKLPFGFWIAVTWTPLTDVNAAATAVADDVDGALAVVLQPANAAVEAVMPKTTAAVVVSFVNIIFLRSSSRSRRRLSGKPAGGLRFRVHR